MDQASHKRSTISELQFLPSFHYIAFVSMFRSLIIEKQENYNKGSFRNKCIVQSNNDYQYLSVPLKKGKHGSISVREVEIAYAEDWPRKMQHRFQSEYGKFPYYSYYIEDILKYLNSGEKLLFDLNANLIEYLLRIIGFEEIIFSQDYHHNYPVEILDIRDQITSNYFRKNPEFFSELKIDHFRVIPAHSMIEAIFAYGPEINWLISRYQEILKDGSFAMT